jgi:signal transduction histidine kinase
VASYISSLNNTISTLRTRIFQLQADQHDPAGLQRQLLDLADAQADQLGYAPQLHFAGLIDSAVDADLADDIVAVTREALSNCARHARASSVRVVVINEARLLTVTITDDGVGVGAATRSSGLSHLRRRAERHHGTFTVTTPEAGGTRLAWTARL